MSLCIYALASPGRGPVTVPGIAGERLRRVRVGSIDALVGDIAKLPRPTEDNLRKYNRTIMALWRRSSALLPARFGTSVRDLSELEVILELRQRSLRRNLRDVRNRAQMTIRLLQGSRNRNEGLGIQSSVPDSRSPGRGYLRARAAEARHASDVPEFAPLRRAVRRWVRAERVEKRDRIATIYHLVPRGSVDRYRRALERTARDADVRLLISGPWPTFAFVNNL